MEVCHVNEYEVLFQWLKSKLIAKALIHIHTISHTRTHTILCVCRCSSSSIIIMSWSTRFSLVLYVCLSVYTLLWATNVCTCNACVLYGMDAMLFSINNAYVTKSQGDIQNVFRTKCLGFSIIVSNFLWNKWF